MVINKLYHNKITIQRDDMNLPVEGSDLCGWAPTETYWQHKVLQLPVIPSAKKGIETKSSINKLHVIFLVLQKQVFD